MMRRPLLVLAAIVIGWVPALASPTKIAVTKLAGDDDGLGNAVAAALDDSAFEIVSAKRVRRAIVKLALGDDPSDRELEKLAAELEVDALVTGKVEQDGHRLRLRIYTPVKKGKAFTVTVGKATSAKFRNALHAAVATKIAAVMPAEADEPKPKKGKKAKPEVVADDAAAADEPKPKKGKKAKPEVVVTDDPPARDAKPAAEEAPAKHVDAAKPAEDHEVPAAPVPVAVTARAEHAANVVAVRLDVGTSLAARDFRFDTRTFDNAPRPYTNAPVPGGRLDAEIYPFAFADPRSALAMVGVAVDYDQTVALALHPTSDPTLSLKATQRRYSVGLRYRIPFGHDATSPTLTIGAGYGRRTFSVDRTQMAPGALDLPDIDDKLFDPGLAFRLPIGSVVALTLGGRALLVTSGGPIESADQYGRAKVYGGEASAGLEIVLRDRVALRLAAEASQVDYQFTGTGAMANSRDGDPSTIDVKSATDRCLGGAATLAVLY